MSHSHSHSHSHSQQKKILLACADGSEETELVGTADILRRAGNDVLLAAVGTNGHKTITCTQGTKIHTDHIIDDVLDDHFDAVVAPGGSQGAATLGGDKNFMTLLKKHHDAKKIIAAICAAPATVLAQNDIVGKDNKMTSYPDEKFTSLCNDKAEWVDERVVVDNHIITSQGPGTVLDFALTIVKHLNGQEKARQVAKSVVYYGDAV